MKFNLKLNFYGYILIIFVILVFFKIYSESDVFNLKCIISNVDGKKYCVRDRSKLLKAADLLAKVTDKLKRLVFYLKNNFEDRKNVQRLVEKFDPQTIKETLPTSEFTAYSENKGEKMAFCLNKNKNNNEALIDENTLTFVAIHELGHIMTESIGHNEEFWNNFKFLLDNAVKINLYTPIDYKKNPQPYCGMDINDNPYYDL
jgi:hypothetical protein